MTIGRVNLALAVELDGVKNPRGQVLIRIFEIFQPTLNNDIDDPRLYLFASIGVPGAKGRLT